MIHPAEMATDETMDDQTVAEAPESATPCSSSAERIRPLALVGREAVEQLSRGFLSVLEPELVRVHKSLEELVYVSFLGHLLCVSSLRGGREGGRDREVKESVCVLGCGGRCRTLWEPGSVPVATYLAM